MAASARLRRGYVTVDIQLDEVLDDVQDADIREEYEARFGAPVLSTLPSRDLVAEILAEIVAGRIQSAAALCEGHLNEVRITEEQRQAAYQAAGRAH